MLKTLNTDYDDILLMIKKLLLILFAAGGTLATAAQSTKISRVEVYYGNSTTAGIIYNFSYDASGRLTGSDWSGGSIRVTYDTDNTIRIESSETDADLEWTVSHIENGRITRVDRQYGGDNHVTISYLTYDNEGQLIGMSDEGAYDGGPRTSVFSWQNVNMVSMVEDSFDGEDDTNLTITPSEYDTPASFPFYMPLIDCIGDFDLPNPTYYLPDYMGKMPRKLISEISGTWWGVENYKASYTYRFDAAGNVSEIIADVHEEHNVKERIVCSYTTVTGAAENLIADGGEEPEAIYDLYGRPLQQMSRGLNIVKGTDGTVRKVVGK